MGLGPTVLHAQIVPGTILRICHTHIRYILIIIRLHSSRNMYHIIVIHIFLYIYMHAKTLVHLVQYMYVCAHKNHKSRVCLPAYAYTHTPAQLWHVCASIIGRISKPVACRCTNLNAPMPRNTWNIVLCITLCPKVPEIPDIAETMSILWYSRTTIPQLRPYLFASSCLTLTLIEAAVVNPSKQTASCEDYSLQASSRLKLEDFFCRV